jgi:hypothetical protein
VSLSLARSQLLPQLPSYPIYLALLYLQNREEIGILRPCPAFWPSSGFLAFLDMSRYSIASDVRSRFPAFSREILYLVLFGVLVRWLWALVSDLLLVLILSSLLLALSLSVRRPRLGSRLRLGSHLWLGSDLRDGSRLFGSGAFISWPGCACWRLFLLKSACWLSVSLSLR